MKIRPRRLLTSLLLLIFIAPSLSFAASRNGEHDAFYLQTAHQFACEIAELAASEEYGEFQTSAKNVKEEHEKISKMAGRMPDAALLLTPDSARLSDYIITQAAKENDLDIQWEALSDFEKAQLQGYGLSIAINLLNQPASTDEIVAYSTLHLSSGFMAPESAAQTIVLLRYGDVPYGILASFGAANEEGILTASVMPLPPDSAGYALLTGGTPVLTGHEFALTLLTQQQTRYDASELASLLEIKEERP